MVSRTTCRRHGIRTFVYRARRPFLSVAFYAFVNRPGRGVVRAKGFFWLATRPNFVGELAQAGAMVRTSKRGLWCADVPRERWPESPEWHESIKPYFDHTWEADDVMRVASQVAGISHYFIERAWGLGQGLTLAKSPCDCDFSARGFLPAHGCIFI